MGTNYYVLNKRINNMEDLDSGLHIGKNSCGWVFHFEARYKPKLKTVQDYKSYLKEGYIYNEYGTELTYDEFWEVVESSKELFNGEPPYVLADPNYPHESPYGYEDEGFAFSEGDFS